MAQLSAAERAKLPDRAFAYVDSKGRRRLPIFDAAHVRNALARFNQVEFENDRSRDAARKRLLHAARRFRIVPVGFISAQLRTERERGPGDREPAMPAGFVTLLMTDIEGSTALVERLGDEYGDVLGEVRDLHRCAVEALGGCVVEARADEFFAAYECPRDALDSSIRLQRDLAAKSWPFDGDVLVRVGLHAGYPTPADANYIGMAVHTAARICAAAHGGQIVISGDTRTALTDMVPEGVRFDNLGVHHLRGIPGEHQLLQVVAEGLPRRFPPPRV